jgi:hypothetical protein
MEQILHFGSIATATGGGKGGVHGNGQLQHLQEAQVEELDNQVKSWRMWNIWTR